MDLSVPYSDSLKKTFFVTLIASVVLSALLGIAAILSGRFGWVEIRVILTTATIALASICGLACGAYLSTKTNRLLPYAGVALTFLAATMVVAGMWVEIESITYWKIAASSSVFAVACAHLSLLSMARIAEGFQWSLTAAHVIIFGVASLISAIIFFEIDETGMFQLLGVAAIVDAAITILIPIFHRLSRSETVQPDLPRTSEHQAIDAKISVLRREIAQLEAMKQKLS
ncbi:MAG: hypothetical protein AAFN77_00235 [Planctomycetota bacterium]